MKYDSVWAKHFKEDIKLVQKDYTNNGSFIQRQHGISPGSPKNVLVYVNKIAGGSYASRSNGEKQKIDLRRIF